MIDKITLIIPTHNRHQYLMRILDYYKDTKMQIMICDSSDLEFTPKSHYPDVSYFHFKNHTMTDKLYKTLRKVKTEYCFLCADDDFIIKENIPACLEFLEQNADYQSVQGNWISFYRKGGSVVYGPSYMHSVGLDITAPDPVNRIKRQLHNYMEQTYSIHRTKVLLKAFSDINGKIKDYNLMELYMTITCAAFGKHKILPLFYGARESISGSTGESTIKIDKLRTLEKYRKEYECFIELLIEMISELFGFNRTKAGTIIDSIIDCHIRDLKRWDGTRRMMIIHKLERISPKFSNFIANVYFELKRIYYIHKTRKIKGFPFFDFSENEKLKEMESVILKHNINSRWRSITI